MTFKRVVSWTVCVIAVLVLLVCVAVFVAYWRSTNDCGRVVKVPENSMQAITYCDYGSPDVLKLEKLPKPIPRDDQVLIKVHATSVNPLDWHYLQGTPYLMRLETGLRKPKSRLLGVDYAGTIEAAGRNVTRLKLGDEVFGGKSGAFAEYLCATERALAVKPPGVTFAQAASVPIAASTALQALRDKGHLQPGQKVLINGASGGVGTFAVQIAKSMGAEVTGVCSTRNLPMVSAIGADHVIDYTKEDFTKGHQLYDLILDCVGTQPLPGFRRALTPKGRCVLVGGGGPDEGRWLGPLVRPVKALLLSPFVSQNFVMILAEINQKDLATLANLIQAGKVKPVIDRTYQLDQVPDALRYLEKGHAKGKVIIQVGPRG